MFTSAGGGCEASLVQAPTATSWPRGRIDLDLIPRRAVCCTYISQRPDSILSCTSDPRRPSYTDIIFAVRTVVGLGRCLGSPYVVGAGSFDISPRVHPTAHFPTSAANIPFHRHPRSHRNISSTGNMADSSEGATTPAPVQQQPLVMQIVVRRDLLEVRLSLQVIVAGSI